MQVAILAGGLATRLGSLTKDQAKSMVKVFGKPFLEYQIELLRKQGIRDIVLCIGYLGEQIKNHFGDGAKFEVNIKYSYEEKPLGTAGALKKAAQLLEEEFFTLYGDSYLFLNFATATSFFNSQDKLALMTVYENHDRYGRSNAVVEGNYVKKFTNREKTKDMVYIEYGANIFRKKVLESVPENEVFCLDDLFPCLIEKGELLAFEVKERFYEIGSPQGLKEFEQYVRNTLPKSMSYIEAQSKLETSYIGLRTYSGKRAR